MSSSSSSELSSSSIRASLSRRLLTSSSSSESGTISSSSSPLLLASEASSGNSSSSSSILATALPFPFLLVSPLLSVQTLSGGLSKLSWSRGRTWDELGASGLGRNGLVGGEEERVGEAGRGRLCGRGGVEGVSEGGRRRGASTWGPVGAEEEGIGRAAGRVSEGAGRRAMRSGVGLSGRDDDIRRPSAVREGWGKKQSEGKEERRKKTKKTPNNSAHSLSPSLHPHNYLFSSTSSISSIPLDLL
jgi:hypothetical protein